MSRGNLVIKVPECGTVSFSCCWVAIALSRACLGMHRLVARLGPISEKEVGKLRITMECTGIASAQQLKMQLCILRLDCSHWFLVIECVECGHTHRLQSRAT